MNNTIREIVSSNRGQDKINVHGFIMCKNKNCNNSYYWHCEKRDALQCKEREALNELIVSEYLTKALNGSDFLVKDIVLDVDRILLFTTIANVRYLEQSTFWIMDGTFKTVPNIFRQLYSIHGRVGRDENSQ